jgi:stress response protein YsnF
MQRARDLRGGARVTLYAQRPVVGAEAVPVERIKLGTETVTETETVGGEVRKEQIEFDTTEDSTGRSTNRS